MVGDAITTTTHAKPPSSLVELALLQEATTPCPNKDPDNHGEDNPSTHKHHLDTDNLAWSTVNQSPTHHNNHSHTNKITMKQPQQQLDY